MNPENHEANADPQPLFGPLNARQIARALLSRQSDEDLRSHHSDEDLLEELLLWPPDLFAFTSLIFSVTGAYHMVISPPLNPSDASWPPVKDWSRKVREIGFNWRTMLAGHFTRTGKSQPVPVLGCFNADDLKACKDFNTPFASRKTLIQERVGQENKDGQWQPGSWVPKEVGEHFAQLRGFMPPGDRGKVQDLFDEWPALVLLMTLHAIVDEACVGWGIREIPFLKTETGEFKPDTSLIKTGSQSEAAKFAAKQLGDFGTMATFSPWRGRVLPKRHTPGVGITLRSMTSNLAFHRSSVEVNWRVADNQNVLTERLTKDKNKIFSMLLLPWPERISARDFKNVETKRLTMADEFGFFSYEPTPPDESKFGKKLRATLAKALKETKEIDIVVLPECALDKSQIALFERIIGDEQFNVSAYVAGVRGTGTHDTSFDSEGTEDPSGESENRKDVFTDNMVYFKMGDTHRPGEQRTTYNPREPIEVEQERRKETRSEGPKRRITDVIQYKHHRWKVDKFQIQNYNLGHALSPTKNWWESIKIRRRKVTFINVGNELTICPLICEDLSRQDPIADLIRTVGPSLAITILMDGPQKKERWSARYASVLSEDPGCAVITLTSAGMVDRWTHPTATNSRAVALWNDGQGFEREITLEKGAVAILLSLSISPKCEVSADGRTESYATNQIILGGIHQVFL